MKCALRIGASIETPGDCAFCRAPYAKTAVEQLNRLVKREEKGDAMAQLGLGECYRDGTRGLAKDGAEAARLIRLAASQPSRVRQTVWRSMHSCTLIAGGRVFRRTTLKDSAG